MTTILAIESSTLTASVALLIDGDIVFQKESGVNTHSEVLLNLVDDALSGENLKLTELTTIAVGCGPGSFTGLRIGMATAKGLCFAADVPLTTVSSLAAVAMDCSPHCPANSAILSVLDARRGEIFVGLFQSSNDIGGPVHALTSEQVMLPDSLQTIAANFPHEGPFHLCGDGAHIYAENFTTVGTIQTTARKTPSAAAVALLAQYLSPSPSLAKTAPTYIRLPEAQIKFPNGNTGGTFAHPQKPKSG